ncbi:hypothetical protein V6N13_053489 [Hibiscus sabdariffa]
MYRASLAPASLLSRDLKQLAHNVQLADGLAAMARLPRLLCLCLVRAAWFVVCLPFDDALASTVGASRSCGSCTHPSGHVSHSHMPWPYYLCPTTGLLVSLRGVALVEGLTFFLPITDWNLGVVPVVAADGYLSCFPSFHIAWCASMPMLWFLCLRPTLVLVADFVSGIGLVARPFQWSLFNLEFAASHADWSMEQPFSVALATAEGAPLIATSALVILGVSAPCTRVSFFACILRRGCSMVASMALPSWPGLTGGSVSGLLSLPALPHGCPWNSLVSRPDLMIGYLLVLQVTFIGPNSTTIVSLIRPLKALLLGLVPMEPMPQSRPRNR